LFQGSFIFACNLIICCRGLRERETFKSKYSVNIMGDIPKKYKAIIYDKVYECLKSTSVVHQLMQNFSQAKFLPRSWSLIRQSLVRERFLFTCPSLLCNVDVLCTDAKGVCRTHSGVCHSDMGVMTNRWVALPHPTQAGQVGGAYRTLRG
jgi:propanol-preferring alcohol dehydrogenase